MKEKEREKQSAGRMRRSVFVNIGGIFCSRVFGLLRDIVMTWYWGGSGAAQAAFHLAFSIPNMLRMLFGEGAFTAAFVPAFSNKLENGSRDDAWRFAERVITLQILALLGVILLFSFASIIIYFLLPEGISRHIPLTFRIIPMLMPYSLLICVAGCLGSILNALRKFALPSINPVLFNIVQIASVYLISRLWKNDNPKALYCFCGSVILAGIVQMLSLMAGCRRQGFKFHFCIDCKNRDVSNVCKKILPGIIGAGANQINQFIDKIMVGYLGTLAVSSISYSNHLVYLPVGLFGVAIGIVCLTDMSRAASRRDQVALSSSLTYALQIVLFFSLPCCVFFYVYAEPFVRLMFFRGAFNEESVQACVYALKFYLPGIPAFCMVKVATTPHHAHGDTTLPVRIALGCILLNFILNISLIWTLRQGGLALSTSICSWVNVFFLLFFARKHLPDWKARTAIFTGALWLLASIIASVCSLKIFSMIDFQHYFKGTWLYLAQVIAGGGSGAIIYIAIAGGIALIIHRRHKSAQMKYEKAIQAAVDNR